MRPGSGSSGDGRALIEEVRVETARRVEKPVLRKSGALAVCGAMSVALALCLGVGGPKAEIGFACIATAFPVVLIWVGALRGRAPSLRVLLPLAVLAVQLVGSLVWLLELRGSVEAGDGWPAAASVLLLGLWLSPLLVAGLGYALLFDRYTLREEDLERLRRVAGSHNGRPESKGRG